VSSRIHPINDRSNNLIPPGVEHFRHPPVYVTEHGEHKHDSPLCPHVRGRTHYALCREDALFALGERWCSDCGPFADLEQGSE